MVDGILWWLSVRLLCCFIKLVEYAPGVFCPALFTCSVLLKSYSMIFLILYLKLLFNRHYLSYIYCKCLIICLRSDYMIRGWNDKTHWPHDNEKVICSNQDNKAKVENMCCNHKREWVPHSGCDQYVRTVGYINAYDYTSLNMLHWMSC